MSYRLRKCFLFCLLVVFVFFIPKYKNGNEESFWQVGKNITKEYLVRKVLYSQSVIWGFIEELDAEVWQKKQTLVEESFLDLEIQNAILKVDDNLEEKVKKENMAVARGSREEFLLSQDTPFSIVEEKQVEYNLAKYKDINELIKQFYIVDPTAGVKKELFDIELLYGLDLHLNQEGDEPQILIYHTHSQESFSNSEAGKEEDTIVGAGEILASYLEEYGFRVLHHKGKYDVKNRDYAYSEAMPEIEKILKANPSIQVVLDLHRDAVAEDTKLVTEIQGKQVAKVMFFNGLSCSAQQGDISYLKNPYLQENLAFSFQMKLACDEYYPGFARSIYLRAYRYNMHLCPKTLLVELGAQTNTVEEIQGALEPLAHVLSLVLG